MSIELNWSCELSETQVIVIGSVLAYFIVGFVMAMLRARNVWVLELPKVNNANDAAFIICFGPLGTLIIGVASVLLLPFIALGWIVMLFKKEG